MKKFLLASIIFLWLFAYAAIGQTELHPKELNFYSFTNPFTENSTELNQFSNLNKHPEFGILPYNAGCSECFEILEKRTADERYFLKEGTGGKEFFLQRSFAPMHYRDASGNWLTIDPRISPSGEKIFKAIHQPFPTEINLSEGLTSIEGEEKIYFNKNVKQYFSDGKTEEDLQQADENCFYTAGDDGVEQRNFFPGIYRQLIVDRGSIETNYSVIKKQEAGENEKWIVIEDEWTLPSGLLISKSDNGILTADGIWVGDLVIKNKSSDEVFRISKAMMYDADMSNDKNYDQPIIGYKTERRGNVWYLKIFISLEWLNDEERDYPVTIDPLVSVTGTYANAVYGGSGYANNAFTNYSCTYPINLNFPAGAQATQAAFGIYYSTGSGCNNSCWISHGALDLVGPCGISESAPGVPWSCYGSNFPGQCYGNSVAAGVLINCLTPSCTPTPVTITLRLMRKYCAGASQCDNACIRLNPNTYTVTLQGISVQSTISSTATGNSSCVGAPVTLTSNPQYGVAPYTFTWNPGGLSGSPVTVNPVVNTTYTLTTTDACGNTVQSLALVNMLATPTATFTVSNNLLCVGEQNTITYTGNGGAGATYNWNFGGATVISGSGSGPYTLQWNSAGSFNVSLTVTGASCTSQPFVQSVTVGAQPNSLFTIANPQCANQPVTITYTGNAPAGATYNWNFGGGTIISGSGQGPYQIQWNTAGNYSVTLQVTISSCVSTITTHTAQIQAGPTATINATSPTCEGQNTLISYSGNGGAGATYNWNFDTGIVSSGSGQGPYQINWITAGTYNIQLTVTKNGCVTNATPQQVVVNPIPTSTFNINSSPVCIGSSVTITYTGSAGAGATYNWQWGTGAVVVSGSGQGPYTVYWNTQGNKQVKLTVTENGCSSTQSVSTVSVTAGFTSTFTMSPSPVCEMQNTTITYTGNANATASYTWNFGGGVVTSGSGQGPYQVHWASNGNHVVSLTVIQNGCTSAVTVDTIHVNPPPYSNFIWSNPCAGQITTLNYAGNAGNTALYSWNFGGGTIVSGSGMGPYQIIWNNPGTYTVTLTVTKLGCSATTSHDIIVVLPPTSDFTVSSPGCAGMGDTINYIGNANVNAPYNWYFGGGTIVNSGNGGSGPWVISYPAPGVYTVTLIVTDFGCPSLMTTHTIDVNPIPDATFNIVPSICINTGAAVSYSGISPASATYNWNFGGGTIVSGSGQGPYQISWSTAGVHTVSLSVTDSGCTSNIVSHNINVLTGPAANFTATSPICADENSIITFVGTASGAATFNWNFGNATVVSGSGSGPYQLSFPSSGTYPISLSVADFGCNSSTTQDVLVNPVPTSFFTSSPLNACDNIPVDVVYTGSGNTSAVYNWGFGTGSIVSGSGQGPYKVLFSDTGTHSISLVVTQQQCSSDTQSVTLYVNPSPQIDFSSPVTFACDNLTTSFINNTTGAISYQWNFGDGTSDTSVNTTHQYAPGKYDVSLSATNQFGCTSVLTKPGYINVQPTPSALFTSSPDAGLAMSLEEAEFVFENLSENATGYLWTFGDGDSSGLENPVHIYKDTGMFAVTLIAYNDVGCSDTITINPYIIVPADLIFIPNAFTPNDDGRNDLFRIYGKTISSTVLQVFDRWGELIFEGDGYKDGWNGQFKGVAANTGVYVYRAVITKNSGKQIILQGDVNLIR